MELTKRNVATLPAPANSNRIYFDDATWGLGLRVTAAGARSWVLNYTVAGKQRRFTLGRYRELSLQQARARASNWRDKIKQGVLVREADERRADHAAQSAGGTPPRARAAGARETGAGTARA